MLMNKCQEHVIEPLLLSVKQTAEVLGVCHKTIYRLLSRRLLKASPHLRHKMITLASIKAFGEFANT